MWFRFLLMLAMVGALVSCRLPPRDTPARAPSPPAAESAGAPATRPSPSVRRMLAQAPDLDPVVLQLALEAQQCAVARGAAKAPDRLAVIDYTRPSIERRLWIF